MTQKTIGTVLAFPTTTTDLLVLRVKREFLKLKTQRAIMGYIQGPLLDLLPDLKLKRARLDIIFDSHQDLFVVYLYADLPGFPLTVKGPCERSCLVAVAEILCRTKPVPVGQVRRLLGIIPPFIEPMKEFFQAEED